MEPINERVLVAVVYASGSGRTRQQAAAVARGAASLEGGEAQLIDVQTMDEEDWAILAGADAIIFGSPTYMGGPSADFKRFMEATSGRVYVTSAWKDKLAAGFTNSQALNGDKQNTLIALATLAAQLEMHWVNLAHSADLAELPGAEREYNRLGGSLGALAQTDARAEAPHPADLFTAEALGRRVAAVARQLRVGRVQLEACEITR